VVLAAGEGLPSLGGATADFEAEEDAGPRNRRVTLPRLSVRSEGHVRVAAGHSDALGDGRLIV